MSPKTTWCISGFLFSRRLDGASGEVMALWFACKEPMKGVPMAEAREGEDRRDLQEHNRSSMSTR